MELVLNADWILTKNTIIQKVNQLLGQVLIHQQAYIQQAGNTLPAEVIGLSPKISKGDNYKGLPYLVLDYPRFFNRTAIFAVRTFFWWGNFFSITLHLAGHYKNILEPVILQSLPILRQQGFYICIHPDQWEHHFEESNYLLVPEISESAFQQEIVNRPFIKLAKKIPLEQWDEAENILQAIFSQLIQLVTR